MNKVPLALDTCALSNWDFLKWLESYHEKKVISPIVYMEFSVYMLKKKKEHHKIRKLLMGAGIEIKSFDLEDARAAADHMFDAGDRYKCSYCGNTNWNDCLIAAHAPLPPYIFVTENVKDYYSLLDEKRVKTPNEIMYPGRK
jgi:predicted nucleic acid-binding protein